jgi:hypothetical protein
MGIDLHGQAVLDCCSQKENELDGTVDVIVMDHPNHYDLTLAFVWTLVLHAMLSGRAKPTRGRIGAASTD